MIDPAIKDMETWEEAEKWLERHGYGPGLFAQQKELWSAPVVEVKPEPKPAPKPTPKAEPKPEPKTEPKPKAVEATKKGA